MTEPPLSDFTTEHAGSVIARFLGRDIAVRAHVHDDDGNVEHLVGTLLTVHVESIVLLIHPGDPGRTERAVKRARMFELYACQRVVS